MDLVTIFQKVKNNKKVKENGDEALVYSAFVLVLVFAGKFLTDFKFSAVITLGAAVQCLGFCLLRLKIRQQRGAMGISSRTLQMFAVMYVCRLYSTLQYNGYLPVDRTGDWVYQACDVVALLVIVSLLTSIHSVHESSYDKTNDTCAIHWFVLGCVMLAYLIHPSLNNRRIPDMAWTAALYCESVAMVPQLYLLTKKGGEVESLASHYIACVFVSRLLMMTFWFHSYHELKPKDADFNFPGYGVMGAQALQCVLFGDFMYYYVKSIRDSSRMVLPQAMAV
jgi:hypothetical protein